MARFETHFRHNILFIERQKKKSAEKVIFKDLVQEKTIPCSSRTPKHRYNYVKKRLKKFILFKHAQTNNLTINKYFQFFHHQKGRASNRCARRNCANVCILNRFDCMPSCLYQCRNSVSLNLLLIHIHLYIFFKVIVVLG